MKQFNVWNDADPLDSFYVQAETLESALLKALEELGWCMGKGEEIDEETKEGSS
jgi:hypothetical protein